MKKLVLETEDDFDFALIAISCHAKDYKICWSINKEFKFNLKREEDILIKNRNEDISYSLYIYDDELRHCTVHLIENRSGLGYLIPEQKQADYFVLVKGYFDEVEEMIKRLKKIDVVLTAYSLDPTSLKSKNNLLI
ncbi:MAG: IPExxxVDY family protein [Flavobacteriales bacterium]|nr:IPExxxVDY family protein [Flavobacteriales bacterium]